MTAAMTAEAANIIKMADMEFRLDRIRDVVRSTERWWRQQAAELRTKAQAYKEAGRYDAWFCLESEADIYELCAKQMQEIQKYAKPSDLAQGEEE